MTVPRLTAAVALACVALGSEDALSAQGRPAAPSAGVVLSGQVRDSAARPIADAYVVASLDGVARSARADSTGQYRIEGLTVGTWSLVTRALGYLPDTSRITVTSATLPVRRDITLRRVLIRLDRRIVSATWTGVRGVVGSREMQPVASAKITLVGESRVERTDERGEFAFAWPGGQSVLLRVEAPGFRTRLLGVEVPDGPSRELSILLDSDEGWRPNLIISDDLERRVRWASPLAAYVSREELLRQGTRDAAAALVGTPGFSMKSLVIERDACVFVDGVAKPGIPLDAIDIQTIEFIEVYSNSDRSGTLAQRWPRGAPCGAPVSAAFRRWIPAELRVRYVVVWTRQP